MGRISWHTPRTKAGNEKTILERPQEWFSLGNGESSRLALSDLVRRHRGNNSSTTISSKPRKVASSIVTAPAAATPRPALSPEGTRPPTSFRQHDRPATPTRNLLDRGAQIIRRTGSRMSISSTGSASAVGPSGHSRSNQSSLSEMKPDNLHAYISKPYGFHHVTHAERAQVQELMSSKPTESSSSNLLQTVEGSSSPPPPAPVAKDSPPQLALPSTHLSRMASSSSIFTKWQASPEVELNKPLPTPKLMDSPLLPMPIEARPLPSLPVVHAVSTIDDTARPMMTSPLPTPPPYRTTFEEPTGTLQQQNTIRDFHKPTSKTSTPSLSTTIESPSVDCAVANSRDIESTRAASRLMMSLSMVDSMGWEEAIDEAWDYVSGEDDSQTNPASSDSSWQSSPADIYSSSSTADTSLMSTPMLTPTLVKNEQRQSGELLKPVAYSPCLGLGIEAQTTDSSASNTDNMGCGECTVTRTNSNASQAHSSRSSVLGTDRSSMSSLALMLPLVCIDPDTDKDVVVRPRPESGCLPINILAEMSSGPTSSTTTHHKQADMTTISAQSQQRRSSFLPSSYAVTPDPGTTTRKRSNTYHVYL